MSFSNNSLTVDEGGVTVEICTRIVLVASGTLLENDFVVDIVSGSGIRAGKNQVFKHY